MTTEYPSVLVTGASGHLGSLTVRALLERGLPAERILAGGRNVDKLRPLSEQGVRTARVDYDDPDTLSAALAQVDTVVLISGSEIGSRIRQHQNVIDAAIQAKTKKLIYTSVTEADTTANPVAPEHKVTESAIKASGLPFIIARNNWYTENFAPDVTTARETGVLVANAGLGKVASASRSDYAEGLAALALTEGFLGQILELGGDEAWDYNELARVISTITGREVVYKPLSAAEHAKTLNQSGLDEGTIGFITALGEAISAGDLAYSDGTLSQLIGRPTTPLLEGLRAAI